MRGERGKGNRQLLVEICVSAGQVEQKKQRQIETETDRQTEREHAACKLNLYANFINSHPTTPTISPLGHPAVSVSPG